MTTARTGFNPRAPAGRDSPNLVNFPNLAGFNPRAPAGRDRQTGVMSIAGTGFNPRAPAGRDPEARLHLFGAVDVSIHAPLRGATRRPNPQLGIDPGFNPRAPAGRDYPLPPYRACPTCFNPRAPAGRDLWVCPAHRLVILVSIHAPLRGATRARLSRLSPWKFQSTRPCGARLGFFYSQGQARCFNPRAPAGRDHPSIRPFTLQYRFQSTRPCGARRRGVDINAAHGQFQSTRPCGARQSSRKTLSIRKVFQSTRPCGARLALRSRFSYSS